MTARNRRNAEIISDDVEDLSEHAARTGRRVAEDASERTSAAAIAAFDAFNGPVAKAMDRNRLIFQKMVHAMQQESLRFVNLRLEHTGRAIESSRDSQGVMGLVAAQREFLMDMARDYAEQTRRFADLVQELAADGTSGITEATDAVRKSVRDGARRMETERGAAA